LRRAFRLALADLADIRDETVSVSRHRLDVVRSVGPSPSALRSADMVTVRLFSSTAASGHTTVHQLFLVEEPARSLDEGLEQVEGLVGQGDGLAVAPQAPFARLEAERTERVGLVPGLG
jgi:hypothetical protein